MRMLDVRRPLQGFAGDEVQHGRSMTVGPRMSYPLRHQFVLLHQCSVRAGAGRLRRCGASPAWKGLDKGEISVNGEVLYSSVMWYLGVGQPPATLGMVFQSYAIWPHMNVYDNVAFPLRGRHAQANHQEEVQATRRTCPRGRRSGSSLAVASRPSSPAVSSNASRWPGAGDRARGAAPRRTAVALGCQTSRVAALRNQATSA